MYHLIISEYDNIINVKLRTMTEVLDGIAGLNQSYNNSLFFDKKRSAGRPPADSELFGNDFSNSVYYPFDISVFVYEIFCEIYPCGLGVIPGKGCIPAESLLLDYGV